MSYILLAEGEVTERNEWVRFLYSQGHEVKTFEDVTSLYEFYTNAQEVIDMIIMEMVIPSSMGLQVLEDIRKMSDIPVIIISVIESEMVKVRGLKAGADDYLIKPVCLEELGARIDAIIRRVRRRAEDFIEIETEEKLPINLSPTEHKMMGYLVAHMNKVVKKEDVLSAVWGINGSIKTRVTDDTLKRIRRKLKEQDIGMTIDTVRGVGYRVRCSKEELSIFEWK